MLLRSLLTLLSPGGRRGRLSILIYHRVLPEPDPLLSGDPDAARFRWQMELLARHFNPLPLPEAVQRLREGTLPPRAACVTFDDGYADNAEVALPILQSVGVPATFFIAVGYLNGGRMFNDTLIETVRRLPAGEVDLTPEGLGRRTVTTDNDRVALCKALIGQFKYREPAARNREVEALPERLGIQLPEDLMMRDDQVRQLADVGMEIGGHTLTPPHPGAPVAGGCAPRDPGRAGGAGAVAEPAGALIRLPQRPVGAGLRRGACSDGPRERLRGSRVH